jgi:hypothetical protein
MMMMMYGELAQIEGMEVFGSGESVSGLLGHWTAVIRPYRVRHPG